MEFDCYIFDVDGTLASTNELIFATFNHVAQKYLKRKLDDEEIIALFGPTEDIILEEWMKDNYNNARQDYYDFYSERHKLMADSYPGINDILKKIHTAGKRLAVFTGKGRTSADITLNKIGASQYFDIIITGDEVKNHKPSPEGINKIIDELGLNPQKTLMIGDAVSDIKAARDAGVKVASVVWDSYDKNNVINSEPDYLFHTVEELSEFITNTLPNN